jgi:hypothetical protein
MFWSADIGYVHVVSLNTDTFTLPRPLAPAQLAALLAQDRWLRADLAAVDRAQTPWVVALGHQMLYSTHDASHVAQALLLRDGDPAGAFPGLEQLFFDYGVDVYFAGHEHVYERFKRAFRSRSSAPRGTACIVVGNAGDREFPYHNGSEVEGFAYPMPEFESARSAFPSGLGVLSVPNASTMVWQQLIARNGTVLDSHVFRK